MLTQRIPGEIYECEAPLSTSRAFAKGFSSSPLDGAIVTDENIGNTLLDVAVALLKSGRAGSRRVGPD